MKKCVLHIGMHKTGSSSIQNYLETNRKLLGSKICYADMGTANHSGPLLFALLDNPSNDDEIISLKLPTEELREKISYYRQKLIDALSGDFKTIIFSAESLVKLSEVELESFRKTLLQYIDTISVVCYVREPVGFISSAYQQIIKTVSISPLSPHICPNYRNKFEKFEKVFGGIDYRVFSKDALSGGDVVKDFCSWFALPIFEYKNINVSLGALAVKILSKVQGEKINNLVSPSKIAMLESALSELPDNKFILPSVYVDHHCSNNKNDFLWMKSRFTDIGEKFDISPHTHVCHGYEGIFTEDEKEKILKLKRLDILSNYVQEITGSSLVELLNKMPESMNGVEARLRRFGASMVLGWAFDQNDLSRRIKLDFYLNNEYSGTSTAAEFREDLLNAGLSDGKIGFSYDFGINIKSEDHLQVRMGNLIIYSGSFYE